MSRWRRALRLLRREYLSRGLPHGLLGPALFWPDGDERRALHRRLWWQAPRRLPRPLWLLGEFWLWLRWAAYHVWRQGWTVLRRAGPQVRAEEHISLPRQAGRLLVLGLGWGIPPADVYRFQLYRRPAAAADYIYDHELAAYHRWRSPGPSAGAARQRLQDKLAAAAALAARGVPVAQTLDCVTRHSAGTLASRLGTGACWFCKTRSGHAGRGAFTVWRVEGGLRGCSFQGRALDDTAAVEQAWRELLALDDALIQPRLENHPALQALGTRDDAITLRLITQGPAGSAPPGYAALEIPAPSAPGTAPQTYVILPLDPRSGCPRPLAAAQLPEPVRRDQAEVCARLPTDFRVPFWEELLRYNASAHGLCPELWAVAWDWVITPGGPVLLEGNAGFGLAMPQMVRGGLAAAAR
ncbi:sugar-transfer associated ATP-grasp domain-containing protein [Solimonas sp. SE-A11]|uniref:sugar-transfer associated ATP-grasp domain-containing protein n=1 Tax=Solimonas sp. SE-A11 TaxID=3054954 RepID=UPI00259C9C3F|nr:sugar-transfer associated ATP-grasp domain-containing protein [Solimonas sp. SE-A11]MDM4769037.1 sugar-transfer associated ATP-grasp domain-containing protein [Solimonas sp. SE-A11]